MSCLAYNYDGALLVSGSSDTNIIVWDCVGESGLFRLHGHKNQVTDAVFVTKKPGTDSHGLNYLLTSSTVTTPPTPPNPPILSLSLRAGQASEAWVGGWCTPHPPTTHTHLLPLLPHP